MNKLNFYCENDSAVLWWEKPKIARSDWSYQIALDGNLIGESQKTHYTIENLLPDHDYTVTVRLISPDKTIASNIDTLVHTTSIRKRIDVTASPYFAKGDGKTLNTKVLQQAFDDCPDGACVYFPAGTYLTGGLRVHSHTEVYLDKDATLQGTAEPKDYLPRIHSRFEGIEMECYQSVLNLGTLDHDDGYNCCDVIIHGKGSICGGGFPLAWATIESERELLKDYLTENAALVATCENNHTIPGRVRGRLINISNCQNIRISGLTLADGASWNVHMIYSDNIITNNCTFRSKGVWNGDGWDPDSSTNCTLFDCVFYTEDDSVAIKSGKNPEGNLINRPTRHIRIFDCFCQFGHGLCMGSEMSGGIEDVKIWDCDLTNSMIGIEIKGTSKRGGYVKDLHVQDCIVPCILAHSVLYNNDGIPAPEFPVFANLTYERVTITGKSLRDESWQDCLPIELRGFDDDVHSVQNVTFKDVRILTEDEICTELCKNVVFCE